MIGGIAIVNESTLVSQTEALDVVEALREQGVEFCLAWSRLPCPPEWYARLVDVPPGMASLAIVDDSDQADALGWHTESIGGNVFGIAAVRPAGVRWPSVLSHEYLETIVDPFVGGYERAPDGRLYPREVCDAVEGQSYDSSSGVALSDWLTPQWFNWAPPPGVKFNRLGTLFAPFTLAPGGYADVLELDGTTTQIGATRPDYRPLTRFSRHNRRKMKCLPKKSFE